MAVFRQCVLSVFMQNLVVDSIYRIDNQTKLQEDFQFIFTALSTLGHDMDTMIDCSDVIPAPKPANFGPARFPAGKTRKDVEQAVSVSGLCYCSISHCR